MQFTSWKTCEVITYPGRNELPSGQMALSSSKPLQFHDNRAFWEVLAMAPAVNASTHNSLQSKGLAEREGFEPSVQVLARTTV